MNSPYTGLNPASHPVGGSYTCTFFSKIYSWDCGYRNPMLAISVDTGIMAIFSYSQYPFLHPKRVFISCPYLVSHLIYYKSQWCSGFLKFITDFFFLINSVKSRFEIVKVAV